MKTLRRISAIAIAWVALGLAGSSAQAQGPAGLQYNAPPAVSPYLNLFTNPGRYANYQTQVQPFLQQNAFNNQTNTAINQLQQQLSSQSGFSATGQSNRIRPTGHPAEYLYYSHYYSQARH